MDATIIRSFQKELFSLFLPALYAGTLAWHRRSLDDSCQSGKMAGLLNSLFFVFKFRVQNFLSASVSNIIRIILLIGAV